MFNPWVRNIPWRRAWQPTLGFLPGEFRKQRRLAGCSPWGHKESDGPEQLSTAHTWMNKGLPGGTVGKEYTCSMQKTQERPVRSLGQKDPLGEKMAAHSSVLAWRIPMDRGAWEATVLGVAKSRTRLSN